LYGACYSIAAILAILGSFGQVASAFREIPSLKQLGRNNEIADVVNKSLAIAFIGMVVIFLPALLVGIVSLGTIELAFFCFVFTAAMGLLNVYSAIARSCGWIFLAEFSKNGFWRLLAVVVLVCTWWYMGRVRIGPGLVVQVTSVVCFIAMMLCLAHLLYRERIKPRLLSFQQLKVGISVDLRNWLVQVSQAALLNMDVVIAGIVLDPVDLGAYFLLTRLASLVALPLSVTNPVIIPVISRLAKGENRKQLQQRVGINSAINICGSVVLLVALFVLFPTLYNLLSGGEKGAEFTFVFMLLAIAQVSNSMVGPTTMACQIFDVRKKALVFIVVAVVVQSVLVGALGYSAGIFGVALAVSLVRGLLNVGIFGLIYRKGGFNLFNGKLSPVSQGPS